MKRYLVAICMICMFASNGLAQLPSTYKELCEHYKFWEDEQDTAKMLKVLKRGFKLYPEEHFFVTNLMAIRIAKKDFNEARSVMKKAVKKVPGDPLYWYLSGHLNEASGNWVDAEYNYLQALSIDKDYVQAITGMGGLYYRRGLRLIEESEKNKMSEAEGVEAARPSFMIALQYLEKALSMQNDNHVAITNLMSIYKKTGDVKRYSDMEKRLEMLQ